MKKYFILIVLLSGFLVSYSQIPKNADGWYVYSVIAVDSLGKPIENAQIKLGRGYYTSTNARGEGFVLSKTKLKSISIWADGYSSMRYNLPKYFDGSMTLMLKKVSDSYPSVKKFGMKRKVYVKRHK